MATIRLIAIELKSGVRIFLAGPRTSLSFVHLKQIFLPVRFSSMFGLKPEFFSNLRLEQEAHLHCHHLIPTGGNQMSRFLVPDFHLRFLSFGNTSVRMVAMQTCHQERYRLSFSAAASCQKRGLEWEEEEAMLALSMADHQWRFLWRVEGTPEPPSNRFYSPPRTFTPLKVSLSTKKTKPIRQTCIIQCRVYPIPLFYGTNIGY